MNEHELAAIRKRVADNAEGDVMFGRDEMAGVLAELDRMSRRCEVLTHIAAFYKLEASRASGSSPAPS